MSTFCRSFEAYSRLWGVPSVSRKKMEIIAPSWRAMNVGIMSRNTCIWLYVQTLLTHGIRW